MKLPSAIARGACSAARTFGLCAAVLSAGCAELAIQSRAQEATSTGHPKEAIAILQDGLRRYPESVTLRSALMNARTATTIQTRAKEVDDRERVEQGADDSVDLESAHQPANGPLTSESTGLSKSRRLREAAAKAQAAFVAGNLADADAIIEQALKDAPRDLPLLSLRRRVNAAQRGEEVQAIRNTLLDSRSISLDFRDANLRNVLDVVSRTSGMNFVFDRDVRTDARVTVFMRHAKLQDVLDMLTSTNQLAKKLVDDRTVLIYPNTPEKQREYQEQVVRVFYLASADAKGAAAFLRSMLKIHDPFVDERSNMLALREAPETIQMAERLVAVYDSEDPEVLLEIEVLEMNATKLTNLGVKFPTTLSLTPVASSVGGATSALTLGNIGQMTRDNIVLGIGGVTVNLQRQVGDFTTLANPRIRVKSKQKARVLVGDKIPVITTTTATGGFVSDSVTYLDVGLKLDVEPTVAPDDDVSLRMALEVSSLGTPVSTSSGTLAYQISTRNAETSLRLHDGETQLLAGLINKNEQKTSNRLPGIGDLPIIGRLFSSDLTNDQHTELVLAITPHILRNARNPDASEAEIWVGTEASPRLRPVGGFHPSRDASASLEKTGASPAAATGQTPVSPAPSEAGVVSIAPVVVDWLGASDASLGQDIEVQLLVNASTPIRSLPVELLYDSRLLAFVSATEGELLRQHQAITNFTYNDAPGTGELRLVDARIPVEGALGKGTVYKLQFKARGPGDARIMITSASATGQEVPSPAVQTPPSHVVHIH